MDDSTDKMVIRVPLKSYSIFVLNIIFVVQNVSVKEGIVKEKHVNHP